MASPTVLSPHTVSRSSLELDERFGYVEPQPATASEEESTAEPTKDEGQPTPHFTGSRKQRRAEEAYYRKLLKARMKFDQWVEPKGKPETPKRDPVPRKKREKPLPPIEIEMIEVEEDVDDTHLLIADNYDGEETNPVVLYEETELYGQFSFRDTILPQLNRYYFYLKRMKKHDPSAFGHYKQYGMQLLPYLSTDMAGKLNRTAGGTKLTPKQVEKYRREIELAPMFNLKRPTFGCIAFGCNPKVEAYEKGNKWIIPRFIYYMKYEPKKYPPEIERMPGEGDVYRVTVWWDRCDNKRLRWGVPTEFPIWISRDGKTIRVLRTCKTIWKTIHAKRSLEEFDIPDRNWRMPNDYGDWAAQHGLDPQTHLSHIFTDAVRDVEHAQFGDVRVEVKNDEDMVAVFNIDARRMAYFFKDRDYDPNHMTKTGQRQRIFHVVAAYTKKNGTHMKIQYRGLRRFTWAGYRVFVSVPGLDHYMPDDFGVGTIDKYYEEEGHKYITEPELATRLVEDIHKGRGARK